MHVFNSRVLLTAFAVLFIGSSAACLNKFALSSVNAIARKQKNSPKITFRAENFNNLDDYISIDVIGSNVTELCEGMVKNFPVLEFLALINANITSIEKGAFQNVHSLKDLSLAVNRLKHIPRGVFNTVKSLKVIYLSHNQIETIEDAAFSEMPNLKSLHLNQNQITTLSGNILFGSPNISYVDFSYNKLTTIEDTSLDDLQYSTVRSYLTIVLQHNQIDSVSKYALENLKIPIKLHLEFNQIINASDVITSLREHSSVYLDDNQIQCISDEVLEFIEWTQISINITKNPIQCNCVEKIHSKLEKGVKGEFNVVSTLPCSLEIAYF
ncbi:carboxypeptidase N subunit 2-like [Euwallacea fornicatus]|uniref:carboxypeptidase N subunit 2-like n=1 Tax=Euwallacea fornicatus TaxID=995702 RepID=UPI00338F31B9